MATIASLNVAVTANTAQFASGMKSAATATTVLRGSAASASGSIAALTASMERLRIATVTNTLATMESGLARSTKEATMLGRAVKATTGFVHGLATAFLPLAGIGATVAAVKNVEGFNQALARSTSIMDINADQAVRLEAAVREAASSTALSSVDLAKGVEQIASAGFDAEQTIANLAVVAKFAQAANVSTGESATFLADSLNALGLKTGDAITDQQRLIAIGDKLVNANAMSNATVQEFAQALTNKAASAGALFGQSIDDIVGVLSLLAEEGFAKGLEGGEKYSIMLRELAVRANNNAAAWQEYGVAAFNAQGNLRPVPEIIRDLTNVLDGMSHSQKQATLDALGFQLRSQDVFKVLLDGSDAMEDFTRRSKEAGGAMARVADRSMTKFQKGWAKISASVGDVLNQSMTPLVDGLGDMLGSAGDGLASFSTNWRTHWELAKVDALIALDEVKAGSLATMNATLHGGMAIVNNWDAIWQDMKASMVASFEGVVTFLEVGVVPAFKAAFQELKVITGATMGAWEAAFDALAKGQDPVKAMGLAYQRAMDDSAQALSLRGILAEGAAAADARVAEIMAAEGTGAIADVAATIAEAWTEEYVSNLDQGLRKRRGEIASALGKTLAPAAQAAAGSLGSGASGLIDAAISATAGASGSVAGLVASAVQAVKEGAAGLAPTLAEFVMPAERVIDVRMPGLALKGSQEAIRAEELHRLDPRGERFKDRGEKLQERVAKATERTAKATERLRDEMRAMESGIDTEDIP